MGQKTVDELQNVLRDSVFHYTRDGKKAAGRALGTLVELITFYKLESWSLAQNILIETHIPEFGCNDIKHNVEFSVHPRLEHFDFSVLYDGTVVGKKALKSAGVPSGILEKSAIIVTGKGVLRNSAIVQADDNSAWTISYLGRTGDELKFQLARLSRRPVAMFECKRVGVQEGLERGPQTIEKAKQGAYVARTVSALQRIVRADGSRMGFLPADDRSYLVGDYMELYDSILSGQMAPPDGFVITAGITSNHGNWFTSNNMNKELKVLAAAYDYLLFLTDAGLSDFINIFLLEPSPDAMVVNSAFLQSYDGSRGGNRFTKSTIDLEADEVLRSFFEKEVDRTNKWFNVLTPLDRSVEDLFDDVAKFVRRIEG